MSRMARRWDSWTADLPPREDSVDYDHNGNKIHISTSEQGARIVFIASGAVSAVKGDKQSESLKRVAESATIECGDCHRRYAAPFYHRQADCPDCYDDAGFENEPNDGWHETPNPDCKACKACQGHADGPVMGETFFCNGTCR